MCLHPVIRPNPHFNCFKNDEKLSFIKDSKSSLITVPCGKCPSCLALKQEYFIQRVQMESLNNDLWCGMLSYNNRALPTLVVNGYNHKYADSRDIQLLIKRLRNYNVFGKFKYWFISERGGERHRPHWHFLISTPKIKNETWYEKKSREKFYFDKILENWYTNFGSKRVPIKVPNLTYVCKNGHYNYDFHYVDPALTNNGESDIGFYVSKYYLKNDDYTKRLYSAIRLNVKDDATFKYYWSRLRHKTLSSHYLGGIEDKDVFNYLQMCISFSHDYGMFYPVFINPITGQTFPLCPYYKNKLLSIDDQYAFLLRNPNIVDGVRSTPEFDQQKFIKAHSRYEKIIKRINMLDLDFSMLTSNNYERFDNITENCELPAEAEYTFESFGDFGDSYNLFDTFL